MEQGKIGKFIGEVRKEKKMKQKDLADLLGVTNKTVSRWETGKYMPDLSLFTTISEILGISLNELMQGERIIGNKNADSIENSLDKVEGLGYFIEIEMYDKNIPIKEANRLLLEFIKEMDLDITKRNLKGYSYLMYDKTKKS